MALASRVRRTALTVLLWGGFSALTPLCSLAVGTATLGTVTLAWDPSSGTDVITNYNVYYGVASATYTNVVAAGTNTTVSISNLVDGTTYYFAATAVDTFGLESAYSTEVSALIPASKPPGEIDLATISIVTSPNATLHFPIGSSLVNTGQLTFSLDAGAPANARVNSHNGEFTWRVTEAYALTTNSFDVTITDSTSSQQTVQPIVVVVEDYLEVDLGAVAVQAGQNVSLPLTLSSSSGVTNLVFSVQCPAGRFGTATLSSLASGIGSATVQNQGTTMVVSIQTSRGKTLTGSAQVATLNFQAVAGQQSAFVPLSVNSVAGAAANGLSYQDCFAGNGEVVIVGSVPLLSAAQPSGSSQSLTSYGTVGLNYELQYSTNGFSAAAWQPALSYLQTNIAQTVVVTSSSPAVFYRLLAQ
ncbi:MAG: fibronectin type III domain-containing protein [Limisphaerales bacterium]